MVKIFRIITVILLVFWMLLIFVLSSQPADKSSDTSGGFIEVVVKIVYPGFDEKTPEQQEEIISNLQFVTRKTAHFALYAILGQLAFLSVITYDRIRISERISISLCISLIYAISDETHQIYVSGRSGELRDVLIDFTGSLLAILFLLLIARFTKFKFLNKYT